MGVEVEENTKRKGARNEHRSIQLLEAAGYACTRAAVSLGCWEVIGVGPCDVVLLQCKTRDWPGAVEREALENFVGPPYCKKLIHRWVDRKRLPDVRQLCKAGTIDRGMNTDHLKDISDELQDGLEHMKAEGYTDEKMGFIYVACALDDLTEFIKKEDNRTPQPSLCSVVARNQTDRWLYHASDAFSYTLIGRDALKVLRPAATAPLVVQASQ